MKDFIRGRIAAALAEPFDASQSLEWCCGYTYEIFNPSGGLMPQKEKKEPQTQTQEKGD